MKPKPMPLKIVPNMNGYQKPWFPGGAAITWNACRYAQTPNPANGKPTIQKNTAPTLPAVLVGEELTPNILLETAQSRKRREVEQPK